MNNFCRCQFVSQAISLTLWGMERTCPAWSGGAAQISLVVFMIWILHNSVFGLLVPLRAAGEDLLRGPW